MQVQLTQRGIIGRQVFGLQRDREKFVCYLKQRNRERERERETRFDWVRVQ